MQAQPATAAIAGARPAGRIIMAHPSSIHSLEVFCSGSSLSFGGCAVLRAARREWRFVVVGRMAGCVTSIGLRTWFDGSNAGVAVRSGDSRWQSR